MIEESLPPELGEAVVALRQHYDFQEIDERGANGYVLFAENRLTKQHVAIKFYYGEPGERQHDEPRLLASVSSPNVLQIYDARTLAEGWAYFVTPRCTGGDLDDFIAKAPSVHEAIDVALGICSGLSAIHAAGMLHRDLKPANVVVEQGVPLIADFGSVRAIKVPAQNASASRHSVLYRPPEAFGGGGYSRLGDIYQIGVVTYQLLGGLLAYDGEAYLNKRQRREYARIDDPVDRSRYIDECILGLAARGKLLNFRSLPPWVGQGTTRLLKRMTAPEPQDRLQGVADAAAGLTELRVKMLNWRRIPTGARLESAHPPIEFRLQNDGAYLAFALRAAGERRVRGSGRGSLAQMVRQFTSV